MGGGGALRNNSLIIHFNALIRCLKASEMCLTLFECKENLLSKIISFRRYSHFGPSKSNDSKVEQNSTTYADVFSSLKFWMFANVH